MHAVPYLSRLGLRLSTAEGFERLCTSSCLASRDGRTWQSATNHWETEHGQS
jgi:hypothetical protein